MSNYLNIDIAIAHLRSSVMQSGQLAYAKKQTKKAPAAFGKNSQAKKHGFCVRSMKLLWMNEPDCCCQSGKRTFTDHPENDFVFPYFCQKASFFSCARNSSNEILFCSASRFSVVSSDLAFNSIQEPSSTIFWYAGESLS